MGYKTEINYTLKCSNKSEGKALIKNLSVGKKVVVTKSGDRTFVLNSPIMIADHNWNIVGMCKITRSIVDKDQTVLMAVILTVFSKEETKTVSKLIQRAEKVKDII